MSYVPQRFPFPSFTKSGQNGITERLDSAYLAVEDVFMLLLTELMVPSVKSCASVLRRIAIRGKKDRIMRYGNGFIVDQN